MNRDCQMDCKNQRKGVISYNINKNTTVENKQKLQMYS